MWFVRWFLLHRSRKSLLFLSCGPQPCHLKDWEMHVQFKVHGSGKKNLHGDGIAIWYTKDRLHPGNVGLLQPFLPSHYFLWKKLARLDLTSCLRQSVELWIYLKIQYSLITSLLWLLILFLTSTSLHNVFPFRFYYRYSERDGHS